MIKVIYLEESAEFQSIAIKGHAKSAEKGKDLVCAGVSAVVIGAINALRKPTDFQLEVAEGNVSIKRHNPISEHDKIVLETLLKQLMSIEESYPQFIKIRK